MDVQLRHLLLLGPKLLQSSPAAYFHLRCHLLLLNTFKKRECFYLHMTRGRRLKKRGNCLFILVRFASLCLFVARNWSDSVLVSFFNSSFAEDRFYLLGSSASVQMEFRRGARWWMSGRFGHLNLPVDKLLSISWVTMFPFKVFFSFFVLSLKKCWFLLSYYI